MALLAFSQGRVFHRGPTGSGHAVKPGPTGPINNRIVGSPGAAADALRIGNGQCRATTDRHLLQGTGGDKRQPATVGREERTEGAFGTAQRRGFQIVQRPEVDLRIPAGPLPQESQRLPVRRKHRPRAMERVRDQLFTAGPKVH